MSPFHKESLLHEKRILRLYSLVKTLKDEHTMFFREDNSFFTKRTVIMKSIQI